MTEDGSEALVIAILTNYGLVHQNIPAASTVQAEVAPRGPKLERPYIAVTPLEADRARDPVLRS